MPGKGGAFCETEEEVLVVEVVVVKEEEEEEEEMVVVFIFHVVRTISAKEVAMDFINRRLQTNFRCAAGNMST